MGLKDFYYSIEDKYYAFVEKLAGIGFNLKPVIGAVESAGIPSLPLFLLLLVAIISSALFFTGNLPGFVGETTFAGGELPLTIQAKDGSLINGAIVEISSVDGEYSDSQESINGEVTFSNVPSGKDLEVIITAPGFKELKTKFKAGKKIPRISLEAKTGEEVKLKVSDEEGMPITGASVSYDPGSKTATTDASGTARLVAPIGANVVVTISKTSYDPATSSFTASYAGYTHLVTLRKPNKRSDSSELGGLIGRASTVPSPLDSQGDQELRLADGVDVDELATITVTVGDGTNFIQGAKVTLFKDGTNDKLGEAETNSTGIAVFTNVNQGIKIYSVVTKEGYVTNTGETRTVTPRLALTIIIAKVIPQVNAINFTVILEDSVNPLASNFNGDVYLITPNSNQLLTPSPIRAAPRGGKVQAEFKNIPIGQNAYIAVYSKSASYQFIRTATDNFVTTPAALNKTVLLTKANLENSGSIIVRTVDFRGAAISDVNVTLYTLEGKFLPPIATTSLDGTTQLELAPNTSLYVNASKAIYEGQLQNGAVANFTPFETIIKLAPKPAVIIFAAHEFGSENLLNNVEFNVYYTDVQNNKVQIGKCTSGQSQLLNPQMPLQINNNQFSLNSPSSANGKCALLLVSGINYEVIAKAQGFVTSISTLAVGLEALVHPTQVHSVALFNSNYPNLVTFKGIFSTRQNGPEDVTSKPLEVGEVYTAKFTLQVPLVAARTAVYIRAGDKPGLSDDSVAFINDFPLYLTSNRAFNDEYKLKAATSYLPNACGDFIYNDQFGLYKWIEFQVPRKALKTVATYVQDALRSGIEEKIRGENQGLDEDQLNVLIEQEVKNKLEDLTESELLELLAEAQGADNAKVAVEIRFPFIVLDRANKEVTFSYRGYAVTKNQESESYSRWPEDERLNNAREVPGKKECEALNLNHTSKINPASAKVVNCNSNACLTLAFNQAGNTKLKEKDLIFGDETVFDVVPAVTDETTFPKPLLLTYTVLDFMPNFDDGRLLEFQPDAQFLPINKIDTIPANTPTGEFPQASTEANKYVNLIKRNTVVNNVVINPTLLQSPAVPITFKYADRISLNTKVKMKGPEKPAVSLASLPQEYLINYEPSKGKFTLVNADGTPASKVDLVVDAIMPADAIFIRLNFSESDSQEYNVQMYDDTGCFELVQNPQQELNLPQEYAAYGKNLLLIKYDASTFENPKSTTGKCTAYSANPNKIGTAFAALNVKHLSSPAAIQILLHSQPNTREELGGNVEIKTQEKAPGSENLAVKTLLANLPSSIELQPRDARNIERLKQGTGEIAEYTNEYAALIAQDQVWYEESMLEANLDESYMHVLINNRQYSRDGYIRVMQTYKGNDVFLSQDAKPFVDKGDFWVKLPVQSTRVVTSLQPSLSSEVLAFDAMQLPVEEFQKSIRVKPNLKTTPGKSSQATEQPSSTIQPQTTQVNQGGTLERSKEDFKVIKLKTRRLAVNAGDNSIIKVTRGPDDVDVKFGYGPVLNPDTQTSETIKLVENQAEAMITTQDETVTMLRNTAFKRRSCDLGCSFARWPLTAFLPKETQPVSKVHLAGDLWTGANSNGKVDFQFFGVNAPSKCEDEARGQEGIYDYYWAFSNLEDGQASIQIANAEPMKLTPNDYFDTSCSTEQQLCGKLSFSGGQCINNCGDGWYYGAHVGVKGKLCDNSKFKVTSFYESVDKSAYFGSLAASVIVDGIGKCIASQTASVLTACTLASELGPAGRTAAALAAAEGGAILYDKLVQEAIASDSSIDWRSELTNGKSQSFPSFVTGMQKICKYAGYADKIMQVYQAYALPSSAAGPDCWPGLERAVSQCLGLNTGAFGTYWALTVAQAAVSSDSSRQSLETVKRDVTTYVQAKEKLDKAKKSNEPENKGKIAVAKSIISKGKEETVKKQARALQRAEIKVREECSTCSFNDEGFVTRGDVAYGTLQANSPDYVKEYYDAQLKFTATSGFASSDDVKYLDSAQGEVEAENEAKLAAFEVCGPDSSACEKSLESGELPAAVEHIETFRNVKDYMCSYPFAILGLQKIINNVFYDPPDRAHIAIINPSGQKDGFFEKIGGKVLLDDVEGEVDCWPSELLPTGPEASEENVWNDWETSRLRLFNDGKVRRCMDRKNVMALVNKGQLNAENGFMDKFYITSRG